MIDDGYANFGGGGSIYWQVGDGKPDSRDKYGRYKINGVDDPPDPDEGKLFKLTIKSAGDVVVGRVGDDLVLGIPIEKINRSTPPRIVIQWAYERDELPPGLKPLARRGRRAKRRER